MSADELNHVIRETVDEMEAAQFKYNLSDKQMYDASSDKQRKEYFVIMYSLLKRVRHEII